MKRAIRYFSAVGGVQYPEQYYPGTHLGNTVCASSTHDMLQVSVTTMKQACSTGLCMAAVSKILLRPVQAIIDSR